MYYYVVRFTYCRSLSRGVVGLVTDPTLQYCCSGFWETVLYVDISISRCPPRFSNFLSKLVAGLSLTGCVSVKKNFVFSRVFGRFL